MTHHTPIPFQGMSFPWVLTVCSATLSALLYPPEEPNYRAVLISSATAVGWGGMFLDIMVFDVSELGAVIMARRGGRLDLGGL